MAHFPPAVWRGPVPNESPGQMVHPVMGLVLHIEQGSEPGTNSWFHNKAAQVSAHFGNPKNGPLDQFVDTNDKAWAEVNGNRTWISLENEGNSGDSLTSSQIENAAQLLAWLHQTDGVPLQVTDSVSVRGLGSHRMGGAAWGNHVNCPGDPVLNQRQQIINRASQIVGSPLPPPPAPPAPAPAPAPSHPYPGHLIMFNSPDHANVRLVQSRVGTKADGLFGTNTRNAVMAFQRARRLSVDGIVGKNTWAAMF